MADYILPLIQAMTLFVLVGQLFILHRAFKADHERKREQATIEFVGPAWRDSRLQVESLLGTSRLNEEQLKEIMSDIETESPLRNFLNAVEHLAVGLNAGVYDKEILYRMNGSMLIRMYDRYEPYIALVRKEIPGSYIEYEELATEFKERKRKAAPNDGNIRFS